MTADASLHVAKPYRFREIILFVEALEDAEELARERHVEAGSIVADEVDGRQPRGNDSYFDASAFF